MRMRLPLGKRFALVASRSRSSMSQPSAATKFVKHLHCAEADLTKTHATKSAKARATTNKDATGPPQ